jgi:tricorn protease
VATSDAAPTASSPHSSAPASSATTRPAATASSTSINGVRLLEAPGPGAVLRNQANRQVRLAVKRGDDPQREMIVEPVTAAQARELRYHEWELQRRKLVEAWSDGRIGYVHLRAMGTRDIAQWTRDFYPVFHREGLIIDVRHNGGGNIDSWILSRLMRRAWFYWQGRTGEPTWNMQFAFRGHMAALCDERTGSDGEAFAEGFRRLGLGKVIGTRTWGGEIWLTSSNTLVDGGIATAAEFGVYGPEGQWLIEGHGVEPDIVVDNLPHATFNGADAQLRAAVDHLLERIAAEPVDVPPHPPHPDLSEQR